MSPMMITEADLRAFLGQHCTEVDFDTADLQQRIRSLVDGAAEAYRGAGLLLDNGIYSQALNSMEEVVMRFGEAVALAYGRRIPDGEGYHWKAAEILRLYCAAFRRDMAAVAPRFQTLRSKRNAVKYGGEHLGEGDLDLYWLSVDMLMGLFQAEPVDRLHRNRPVGR